MSKRSKKKRSASASGGGGGESGGGGMMMSMRSGFKNVAGTSQKRKKRTKAQQVWDIAFWVLVVAALIFFAARRFR